MRLIIAALTLAQDFGARYDKAWNGNDWRTAFTKLRIIVAGMRNSPRMGELDEE
jgi:hypothetical protein